VLNLALNKGEIETIEQSLPRLQQLLEAVEPGVVAPYTSKSIEAGVHQVRGEWAAAIAGYEQVLAEAAQQEDSEAQSNAFYSLANTYLEMGDLAQVEETLERAEALQEPGTHLEFFVRVDRAILRVRQGRLEQARQDLARLEELLQEEPIPFMQIEAARAQAEVALAEGRYDDAIAALDQAAEIAGRREMRWRKGTIVRDLAAAHLSRGKPGDEERGRELLEQAQALFEAIGAMWYVEQVKKMQDAGSKR
jgi:tetratricopeptide (TPR) repeat protein